MDIVSKIIDGSIAEPITAIGNVINKIWPSDTDKMTKEALLQRIAQDPRIKQIELNKIEAQHPSIFVAGWRPAIGWTCAIGLFYSFLIRPVMLAFHLNAVNLDMALLITLVSSLLGVEGVSHLVKKRKPKVEIK